MPKTQMPQGLATWLGYQGARESESDLARESCTRSGDRFELSTRDRLYILYIYDTAYPNEHSTGPLLHGTLSEGTRESGASEDITGF
jgi:hypothetical protein